MSFLDLALAALGLAFVCGIVRVAVGPTLADRAVAADVCLFALVAGVSLLAIRRDASTLIDVVLVATLLGFITTISLARLLRREP